MRSVLLVRLILTSTILILPMMAHAQEAAVSGTITDSSGGVLPGVSVRAVHEATGNAFETVTDGRGAYRLALRVGVLRITAELQGFNTMARAIEFLVGQTGVLNLPMPPPGLAETLSLNAEAPLIE